MLWRTSSVLLLSSTWNVARSVVGVAAFVPNQPITPSFTRALQQQTNLFSAASPTTQDPKVICPLLDDPVDPSTTADFAMG